ncbi:MAG TPA: XRE family transcriptional regulator [Paenalcaligenes hominis]|uniref:Transcriptional regulator n=1 Tax=Paenalcaligenes hominis TaxID=643674 RepID=A0A1U9K2G2_9BURK|nr:XRE family transcriptional regulator [Paenalcaligenes hominis]AQS52192.1 transcriptional regulator [Paenalcaligenes hominis]NJB66082.1 transcriptional regulator with XRE-family HTH domain [Paenalcaligenes hominis]GGE75755.1 XRE family transcriptional regulator [Paenalcaligenes hominis]HJH24183.1 XRE family transcriptional regulator [Paenalcaligenes hominis]
MTTNTLKSSASALAKRLRSLRTERNWTLDQASKACGVAPSSLSKIENGLSSPTYDVLLRLAQGFGLDVAELFAPAQEHMGAGRRTIERKGKGELHETPLYEHLVLCSQLANKRMMPFISRIKAQTLEKDEGWSHHAGEEFVYVLTGSIELHTEFYQPAVLNPGDCFYIDSRMQHRVLNHTDEDATVLWISTKPDLIE